MAGGSARVEVMPVGETVGLALVFGFGLFPIYFGLYGIMGRISILGDRISRLEEKIG